MPQIRYAAGSLPPQAAMSPTSASPTPEARPRHGLGGWLWPITWLSAALPVMLAAAVGAALYRDLNEALHFRHGPYWLDDASALRHLGVDVWLTLAAWWWAIRWFARDPRLLRRGPALLGASALIATTVAWIDRDLGYRSDAILASTLFVLALAGTTASRWSTRVRNTFSSRPTPVFARARDRMLFGGPRDWSGWRWLLPGVIFCAAWWLWLELPVHADAALATIPPAPPPVPRNAANSAAALRAIAHPGRYIEASRVALMLSCVAGTATFVALYGLLRGARWTTWAAFLALAFGATAAAWMTYSDWCCPFVDGPPFAQMWRQWCIALLVFLSGMAYRRWSEGPVRAA